MQPPGPSVQPPAQTSPPVPCCGPPVPYCSFLAPRISPPGPRVPPRCRPGAARCPGSRHSLPAGPCPGRGALGPPPGAPGLHQGVGMGESPPIPPTIPAQIPAPGPTSGAAPSPAPLGAAPPGPLPSTLPPPPDLGCPITFLKSPGTRGPWSPPSPCRASSTLAVSGVGTPSRGGQGVVWCGATRTPVFGPHGPPGDLEQVALPSHAGGDADIGVPCPRHSHGLGGHKVGGWGGGLGVGGPW